VRQPTLFDTLPTRAQVAEPAISDASKAPAEARHRLAGARLRVLDRLREGPATTLELIEVGGTRAPARVHELRSLGCNIECETISGERGAYRYTLKV
jgi:hypothetical protein